MYFPEVSHSPKQNDGWKTTVPLGMVRFQRLCYFLGGVIAVYTVNADFGDSPLPVDSGGLSIIRIPAKKISPECWKDWTPNELDSFMTWGLRIMQTTSRIWLILHVWQPEFLDFCPCAFSKLTTNTPNKNTNSHTHMRCTFNKTHTFHVGHPDISWMKHHLTLESKRFPLLGFSSTRNMTSCHKVK